MNSNTNKLSTEEFNQLVEDYFNEMDENSIRDFLIKVKRTLDIMRTTQEVEEKIDSILKLVVQTRRLSLKQFKALSAYTKVIDFKTDISNFYKTF